jgi:DNA replication protein DnaC
VSGGYVAWIGFLAGIAKLSGSGPREWLGWDVLQISSAFDKTTKRTLNSVRDKLPVLDRRLERSEVQEVWEHLERGRPALVEGESGSGKSGIAAAIVRKASERGIPTLFLDTRNYSSAVSAFGDLEQYVGVKLPLRDCLEKLAKRMGDCLLVIDQLVHVGGNVQPVRGMV